MTAKLYIFYYTDHKSQHAGKFNRLSLSPATFFANINFTKESYTKVAQHDKNDNNYTTFDLFAARSFKLLVNNHSKFGISDELSVCVFENILKCSQAQQLILGFKMKLRQKN